MILHFLVLLFCQQDNLPDNQLRDHPWNLPINPRINRHGNRHDNQHINLLVNLPDVRVTNHPGLTFIVIPHFIRPLI